MIIIGGDEDDRDIRNLIGVLHRRPSACSYQKPQQSLMYSGYGASDRRLYEKQTLVTSYNQDKKKEDNVAHSKRSDW